MESLKYYSETYSMHFAGFVLLAAALVAFHLRARWLPRVQSWRRNRHNRYLSLISTPPAAGEGFQDDISSGLSSATFDLHGNVAGSDARKGLDEGAKKAIIAIMNSEHVSFDEARARHTKKMMASNQIGPDGMPLDPKTFTFS